VIDEGYTKYTVHWSDRRPVDVPEVAELDRWRRRLYDAGLIGQYVDSGIGYGNISVRIGRGGEFLISGTRTGHCRHTGREHYALVTQADIDGNSVTCRGAVQASSEALTHAAVYALDLSTGAVVHVHDDLLWERLKGAIPTTDPSVPYGTPEMAREFARLWRASELSDTGVAVMAGHDSGIVSFGRDLQEATERILSLKERRH
jgi:L-ribulose-5-phosphate 4-epimerase